jgi:hypothetical protein
MNFSGRRINAKDSYKTPSHIYHTAIHIITKCRCLEFLNTPKLTSSSTAIRQNTPNLSGHKNRYIEKVRSQNFSLKWTWRGWGEAG